MLSLLATQRHCSPGAPSFSHMRAACVCNNNSTFFLELLRHHVRVFVSVVLSCFVHSVLLQSHCFVFRKCIHSLQHIRAFACMSVPLTPAQSLHAHIHRHTDYTLHATHKHTLHRAALAPHPCMSLTSLFACTLLPLCSPKGWSPPK